MTRIRKGKYSKKAVVNDIGEKSLILRKAIDSLLERVDQKLFKESKIEIDYSGKETEGYSLLPCDDCNKLRPDGCEYKRRCGKEVTEGDLLSLFEEKANNGNKRT